MTETTSPVPTQVDRPLNATQTRNLQKMVKNDFETLTIDLNRAETAKREEVERQIREQWAIDHPESSARALAAKMNAAGRAYNTTVERLRREALAAGVEFSYSGRTAGGNTDVTATDKALEAAVDRAKAEVRDAARAAHGEIRKRKNDAERKVLLASITPAAEVLLASLPTAADLLAIGAGSEVNQ